MIALYLLLAFLILAFFGGFIWLMIEIFGKKQNPQDSTILLNFNSSLDGGNFLGEIKGINHMCKGNRCEITYEVRDVDVRNPQVITQVGYIDSGKLISCPKGFPSKNRNFAIALPLNAEDLPRSFKETLLGKGIMYMTELDNVAKSCEEILRKGIKDREALLKDIGTGEISSKWVAKQQIFMEEYVNNVLNKKDNKNDNLVRGNLNSSTH